MSTTDLRARTGPWRDVNLAEWIEPEVVFRALYAQLEHSFWLDAGVGAEAGVSYIGAPGDHDPLVRVPAGGGPTEVWTAAEPSVTRDARDVFDFLGDSLDVAPGPFGFGAGWVGWFGYELGAREVGSAAHLSRHPDAALMFVDRVIVFDHSARIVRLRTRGDSARDVAWVDLMRVELDSLAARSLEEPAGAAPTVARLHRSRAEYLRMLQECRAAIDNGDAYQICLTNEIRAQTEDAPIEVYRRLRRSNPSHHGGFIRFGAISLLSSSPEQFLRVTPDGTVTTRPIKGTRPRAADRSEDAARRGELLASVKERAENVMIVDLMRNDLARTSVVGSVTTSELFRVESYANVHQLVSTVTSQLAAGHTPLDVVRTCLPAGSMSGAPKHSAMTILDRLEGRARGLYAGAFGYVGVDGSVDLAMVIRSIVISGGLATFGVGGGITTLSVDAEEFDETILKAHPLLAALNAELVS